MRLTYPVAVRVLRVALFTLAAAILAFVAVAIVAPVQMEHHVLARVLVGPRPCPTHSVRILILGQSQASNAAERRTVHFGSSVAQVGDDCFRLVGPMPGTIGTGGSIWPDFADRMEQLGAPPLTLINGAVSGSGMREWVADYGPKYKGLRPRLVIWMQGETDSDRRTSAAQYLAWMKALRATVAPEAQWIIVPESQCPVGEGRWQPLDDARAQFAREGLGVIGPRLDVLGAGYRREDGCHLNLKGQREIATRLADFIAPLVVAEVA